MANYPQRIGEPECRDFLRTGRCKYGASCKYHHPIGGTKAINPNEPPFPIRPGEATCQYYLKNATCKFGQSCKFHHPPEILLSKGNNTVCTIAGNDSFSFMPKKNQQNVIENGEVKSLHDRHRESRDILPQRPGEPDCIYYLRNGKCKYGDTCKYHHPPRINNDREPILMLNQAQVQGRSSYGRQRASSDSIVDNHELQTYLISSGVMHQRQQSSDMVPFLHHGSTLHHSLHTTNHLSTINNSFQQYPPAANAKEANGNNMMHNSISGSLIHPLNPQSNSPQIGSPSISSTTVASSYDNSSLETLPTLPPPRVPSQTMLGSPSQQGGLQSQRSSSSDLPKLNLSSHVHNGNNGQPGSFLARTNSQDEVFIAHQVETPGRDTNFEYTLRIPNANRAQHNSNSYQCSYQYPIIQNQSSNTSSVASLSPPSSDRKSTHVSSSSPNQGMNNPGTPPGNFEQAQQPSLHRNVDDGLSMMADALLSMLDTQEDAPRNRNGSHHNNNVQDKNIQDNNNNNNNHHHHHEAPNNNFNFERRRRASQYPSTRNSLQENMLLESANQLQQQLLSPAIDDYQLRQRPQQQVQLQYSPVHHNREDMHNESRASSSNNSHIPLPEQRHQQQSPMHPSPRPSSGRPPTHFYMPSSSS